MESLPIKCLLLLDALDCKLITRLSNMNLLKIVAPTHNRIPSHCDGIGFRINFFKFFKCSKILFLACFVVADAIFYPAAIKSLVWENHKSLFIAEPRSDFNRCHEQRISENHNYIIYSVLIVILKHYNVQKIILA